MPEGVRLTGNERKILKKIVELGKVSDTELSKDMPISQQAVNQIRNSLEEKGIIQGYIPMLDFKKLGISLFYIMGIQVLPQMWKRLSEAEINRRLLDLPFMYQAMRIPSSDLSYILIFGFRDIQEQERFATNFEKELCDDIEVLWAYTSSVENMLMQNSLNLVLFSLEDKDCKVKDAIKSINK